MTRSAHEILTTSNFDRSGHTGPRVQKPDSVPEKTHYQPDFFKVAAQLIDQEFDSQIEVTMLADEAAATPADTAAEAWDTFVNRFANFVYTEDMQMSGLRILLRKVIDIARFRLPTEFVPLDQDEGHQLAYEAINACFEVDFNSAQVESTPDGKTQVTLTVQKTQMLPSDFQRLKRKLSKKFHTH